MSEAGSQSEFDALRRLLSMPAKAAAAEVSRMSSQRFQGVLSRVLTVQRQQRRESQLSFYKPVSEKAEQVHTTQARVCGVGGGNGSSKTETCLADMAMCTTGIFPASLASKIDIDRKFRGPINVRVVCESLTTVLHPIIIPKLQWWKWTGVDAQGGDRGHWGWIPRDCLINGSWERSWSEKHRELRVLCRDPHQPGKVLGESTWQFMSHDQDASDFASGDFHIILHDEPPSHAIWRENQARTMRVSGRMLLAMTWPDDPAIAVDWIFDEVYEPAQRGDEGKVWINLYTTENPYLDQGAVEEQRKDWSKTVADVRIFGKPIRFSNRVHPLFTDQSDCWCFTCGECCGVTESTAARCSKCDSSSIAPFNHVRDFAVTPHWPTLFVLDPHPRKPHMYEWWQVDPGDDLWQVAEGELNGSPMDVRDDILSIEHQLGLYVRRRLIDPNMGRSPSSATERGLTWQDEFDRVGLHTDLADDSDVGRDRINEYLRPDVDTLSPRIHVHPRCKRTIFQMKRYIWDDYRATTDRGLKQKPKDKNDDDPTMWKYILNSAPTARALMAGGQVFRRRQQPTRQNANQRWADRERGQGCRRR